MSEIEIIRLPTVHKEDESLLHPSIPQGSCLFTAPSGSGKTTLIVNLLLRKVFGTLIHFEHIHAYSPTCKSDASWDLLQPDQYRSHKIKVDGKTYNTAQIHLNDELDEAEIQKIMTDNADTPREERPRRLIIIDDFAADMKNTQVLRRLIMRGRHSKVWCWLTTQLYKRIPRGVRVNMPAHIIWSCNAGEMKSISEELSNLPGNKFNALFREATDTPFGFMYINLKLPPKQRYHKNFEQISIA